MEELLNIKEITTNAILIAVIVGMMNRKLVPGWVYEQAMERLRRYEEVVPQVLAEVPQPSRRRQPARRSRVETQPRRLRVQQSHRPIRNDATKGDA